MKFGKNLLRVIEFSNPEWGTYWMNYKYLKKLINEILESQSGNKDNVAASGVSTATASANLMKEGNNVSRPDEIAKSSKEVQFFSLLRRELKKSSEFFKKAELEHKIRWERIWDAYLLIKDTSIGVHYDKNAWARLLNACVKFYKDVLLLENFAIMNYCGFSKILKKHDKLTGFVTRDAFMKNIVNNQNITHYPDVLELIKKSEQLFRSIQVMETVVPLQAEEKLFIEAIIGLNYQASRLQAEEKQDHDNDSDDDNEKDTKNLPSRGSDQSLNKEDGALSLEISRDAKDGEGKTSERQQTRSFDLGEDLENATNVLVDAAAKLSYHGGGENSPNLGKVLSWMQLTQAATNKSNNQVSTEKEVSTDVEESDTLIVSKNLLKLSKRQLNLDKDDEDGDDHDDDYHHPKQQKTK